MSTALASAVRSLSNHASRASVIIDSAKVGGLRALDLILPV
jgi:hypothetical protein